jgi:allantoin racemase
MPVAKILIVNPNTTASMTETIAAAARAVAAPGTEISRMDLADGTGPRSKALRRGLCRSGLIQALLQSPDADAGIIACF